MNGVAVKTIFRFILEKKKNKYVLQQEIKWQEVSATFLLFKLES